MKGIPDQLRQLKDAIRIDRIAVANLQNELARLQAELFAFKAQYDALITPLAHHIEIVQSAIHTLEHERLVRLSRESVIPEDETIADPPEEVIQDDVYVPVEEQYRRVYQSSGRHVRETQDDGLESWLPPDYVSVEEQYRRNMGYDTSKYSPDDFVPSVLLDAYEVDARTIKRLYRKLARACHPDFASDETDLLYRTQVMVEINAAYGDKDLEALQMIYLEVVGEDDEVSWGANDLLEQYRAIHQRLRREAYDLKQEIFELDKSELMILRHNANSLYQREGRDLLRELANQMEAEYMMLQHRLDDLRRA